MYVVKTLKGVVPFEVSLIVVSESSDIAASETKSMNVSKYHEIRCRIFPLQPARLYANTVN